MVFKRLTELLQYAKNSLDKVLEGFRQKCKNEEEMMRKFSIPTLIFLLLASMSISTALANDEKYSYNGQQLDIIWKVNCDNKTVDIVKVFAPDHKAKWFIIAQHKDPKKFFVSESPYKTYTNEAGNIKMLSPDQWFLELSTFSPNAFLFFVDRDKSDAKIEVLNNFQ